MKVEEKALQVAAELNEANLHFGQGLDNAEDEALWIVLHGCGIRLPIYFEQPENVLVSTVSEEQSEAIHRLTRLRIDSNKPLAYLIQESWFDGRQYFIDERAIIPRSFLVEWISDGFAPWVEADEISSILDLCTGSGCLAITCAYYFDKAQIIASDIDADALVVAAENIHLHGMESRVALNQADGFGNLNQRFDLIICNPPYVSDHSMDQLPLEFQAEPDLAYRGGEDGLDFILPMLGQALEYLNDNGKIIVEAGSASNALEDRFPAFPFTWLSTEYDEMVVFIMSKEELKLFASML